MKQRILMGAAVAATTLATPRSTWAQSAPVDAQCSSDELAEIHRRNIAECEQRARPGEAELCMPTSEMHYDIARCEERAGNVVAAAGRFRRFLAEGADTVPEERRADAIRALAEVESRMARVTVSSNVRGLELRVDGSCAIDEATYDENCTSTANQRVLLVNPGERRLTVKHAGFQDVAHVIKLAPGGQLHVLLNTREAPPANPYRDPAWTGWAVTGGGLVATSIVGVRTAISGEGVNSSSGIATLVLGAGTLVAAGFATYYTLRASRWKPRPSLARVIDIVGPGVQF